MAAMNAAMTGRARFTLTGRKDVDARIKSGHDGGGCGGVGGYWFSVS